MLDTPRRQDVKAALETFQPNILYFWAGCSGFPEAGTSQLQQLVLATPNASSIERVTPEDLLDLIRTVPLHFLLLNVHQDQLILSELRSAATHVVHWTPGGTLKVLSWHPNAQL